jgi:hypothetical protein
MFGEFFVQENSRVIVFDCHGGSYVRRAPPIWAAFLLVPVLGGITWAQSGPALTTVSDTVFRADGTPAGGTLLISWQSFTSADGYAIAGGTKSVTLGVGGALSVQLVPNTGATPANTVYTVVFQLDDGSVKTEFWNVTQTSPTTIAAILTTPGSGSPLVSSRLRSM